MSCCLLVLAVVAAALCCAGLTLGILRGGAAIAVLLGHRRRPRVPRAQLHAPDVPVWIFIAQLGVLVVVVVACAAALWMW